MRRFNFISRSTLFTPAVYTNVMAKRFCGDKNIAVRDGVKKLIENIHDVNFSGKFSDTDIADLRSSLTRSDKKYFQLLDVNPTLEKSVFERELKQKYRSLCLRFHPDCTTGNASKTEIFELVKTAYEKLSDQNFRDDYNFFSSQFEIIEVDMRNLAPLAKQQHRHLDGMYYKYERCEKNKSETGSQKIATAAFLISIGLAAYILGAYIIFCYAETSSKKYKPTSKLVDENGVKIRVIQIPAVNMPEVPFGPKTEQEANKWEKLDLREFKINSEGYWSRLVGLEDEPERDKNNPPAIPKM